MTDKPVRSEVDPLSTVREIIRRSGHEIRNALNGISVNVEVVKSRNGREGAGGEVSSFAQRAASDVAKASALTNGALAIIDVVLAAAAKGDLRSKSPYGDANEIEVMIYGDRAATFVSDIGRLADEIDVSVEQQEQSVILRVLPEDRSHSKD
ncbi:MAG: hypothetical protein M3365_00840 [Gemmatimonadota bacterium]|nr:hypothetical protein [Gemmatimonadota bacterium]